MDSVFGVVGSDFAVVAGGASAARRPLVYNTDKDRVKPFDSHMLLGASGYAGDCERFREALQSCSSLGQTRNGARLDTAAVASLSRGVLFAGAYPVNAMLAGYDEEGAGPSMYCVGAGSVGVHRVEHGAVGCGSELCAAVMDGYYRAGMTVQDAVGLVDRCIKEVRRLGVAGAPASFVIKMVDKDGTREYARRTYVKEIKALNTVVSSGCTRASPMRRKRRIK